MHDVYDVEFAVGKELRYIHKVKDGRDVYLLANLGDKPLNTWVELRGTLTPESWNPHTGGISNPEFAHELRGASHVTKVKVELSPTRALFIVARPRP